MSSDAQSVADVRDADRLIAEGNTKEDAGEIAAALDCYRDAVAIAPRYARAHMNVGNALRMLNRIDEAVSATREAIACEPTSPRPHFNLAMVLLAGGDHSSAEAQLHEVLRLDPNLVDARVALAEAFEAQHRIGEAQAELERILVAHPNFIGAAVNLARLLVRHRSFEEFEQWVLRTNASDPATADKAMNAVLIWLNLNDEIDRETVFRIHRCAARSIERGTGPGIDIWANEPDPARRLRVGYVSGDFRSHPIAIFMRPVLEQHDSSQFSVYCYSNFGEPNPIAEKLKGLAGHWRDVSQINDGSFAEIVRKDGIDILVDLSGHTTHNRLRVFARRAAPIQATWLGYLNTTGLDAMDYRICDGYTDPPGESDPFQSERLFRMPHSQWCYAPWYEVPLYEGLRSAHIDGPLFGSFNQYWKITDFCLDVWSKVLHATPGSRLMIMDVNDATSRRNLREKLAARGIAEERALLRKREDIFAYFRAIASVDIALDTFPYNGATTTLDTLWMGTPIVGLAGDRGIARGSFSILKTLGADELIVSSVDSYVERNARLASDVAWRNSLHSTLRPRVAASPLMDAPQFTRDLEAGYRQMWRSWCDSQVPGR